MSDEHEHELRATNDGLEVVVRFDDFEAISPPLRDALAALADALVAEQRTSTGDEVVGFGLEVGSLGLGEMTVTAVRGERKPYSCWGHSVYGHCIWFSGQPHDVETCNIFHIR